MSFDYIRVDDILAIHKDQIDRFGGGRGVRDPGFLEAALFRPLTGYYPTLIDETAALWESLSQNHPFIDGNKITAFAATYVFYLSMVSRLLLLIRILKSLCWDCMTQAG